jgi:hypothetical protein
LAPADALRAEGVANVAGVLGGPAPRALRAWVEMQRKPGGDSVVLTNPEPWSDGTAIALNDHHDHDRDP